MRKLVPPILAILALLFAMPALACDAATAQPVAAVLTDAAPAPVFAQGPPAEFPGGANVCRIPPPFQRESCICPLFFDPVCGCNGQTYSNACFAACEVRSFTEGACDGGVA